MRTYPSLDRWIAAVSAPVLFLLPLVAAAHVHEQDHEGVALHIEAPHHGHEVLAAPDDDRVRTTGFDVRFEVPAVAVGDAVEVWGSAPAGVDRAYQVPSARAPPSSANPRAPPLLS